ncbi:C2 domain-containing protein [Schizosaccharomyces cryophilus OY26]|uniref:C2 domain-containing protein n=1 Tax=Schizosaccharomyces cryophilus (strain OY26 / ATCC MYA-4695 / CBS 11777 / NBRC 106824 / NRRL Y48691) TaxID=653667 RepID=S9VVM6_SCHCR|nr:C2 domain-containing protein [Schizosaccharomyces cryophilus OY26]EPY50175.1 C2 domain-containing protein [Schizosaccharomyces cryophilus OY26]
MNCRRKPLPLHTKEVQLAEAIPKEELYNWSLKNVLVLFLVQYRALAPSTLQSVSTSHLIADKKVAAISNNNNAINAKEKRGALKYPKEFIKYLTTELENISMGRNPDYQEQLFRGTFAAFYNTISKPYIMKQMKESRRIEDLFLIFTSSVSSELTKRLGSFESNLSDEISVSFIDLCKSILIARQLLSPSSEFIAHLDMYKSKIRSRTDILTAKRVSKGSEKFDFSSFPLLKIFASVFKVAYPKVLLDAENVFPTIDESAIFKDITILIDDLQNDACKYSHSVLDFSNYKAYSTYKTRELQILEQHRKIMLRLNPLLSEIYNSNHGINSNKTLEPTLTCIPPITRPYFRQLLALCLQYRSTITDPSEEKNVSTFIRECSIYWRILPSSRLALSMELAREYFQKDMISMMDVVIYFEELSKVTKEYENIYWPKVDVSMLKAALIGIRNTLLQKIKASLLNILNNKKSNYHNPLALLEICVENGKFVSEDLNPKAELISIALSLQEVCHEIFSKEFNVSSRESSSNGIDEILLHSRALNDRVEFIQKTCPDTIYGIISLPSLFTSVALPSYIASAMEVTKAHLQSNAQGDLDALTNDMIDAYSDLKKMINLLRFYHKDEYELGNFEGFFQPFVDSWLNNVEVNANHWLQGALRKDNFDTLNKEAACSSSIIDLFHAFHQSFRTLLNFEWEDTLCNARFFTKFFRIVYIVLSKYTSWALKTFFDEANKKHESMELRNESESSSSSSWLSKARTMLSGAVEVLPFHFSTFMCILLNNVHYAIQAYEELESKIDLQELVQALDQAESTKVQKLSTTNYLYTVRVIRGENLQPDNAGKIRTSYVVLTDNRGKRIGKTRPIHSMNPRWEDSFEIKAKDSLIITANLWSKGKFGDHEIFGRCSFPLTPKVYGDYIAREDWLNLSPNGELLLRIEMEGEKEHIGFYVGRTYHDLERSQSEMIRFIVNKMEPVISQNLSMSTLRRLLSGSWMDFDKTMTSVTSLFNRATLTSFSKKEDQKKEDHELTDVEIESAINDLLDFFDVNFSVIARHLSKDVFITVMSYVWDEVMCTIEDLLLPPVSAKPIDRKPLSENQVNIVYSWLQFLKDYLHANGEGVKLSVLETEHYLELLKIREYYDKPTDELLEECEKITSHLYHSSRLINKSPGNNPEISSLAKLSNKEIYRSGTIKKYVPQVQQTTEGELERNERIILRILRMRSNSKRFLLKHFQRKDKLKMADAMRNGYVMPLGHLKNA